MVLGRVDGLTALGIRLKDPGEAGAISRELEGAVSGIQAVTPDHLLDTLSEVVYAARHGHSKEKRNDRHLVTLGVVLDKG